MAYAQKMNTPGTIRLKVELLESRRMLTTLVKGLEFDIDGQLPSEVTNIELSNSSPQSEGAIYSTVGGILQQRSIAVDGNISYSFPNNQFIGNNLTASLATTIDARLKVVDLIDTNIDAANPGYGAFFAAYDGANRYGAFFTETGIDLRTPTGNVSVPFDHSEYHTYRITSPANSSSFSLLIDGTLVRSVEAVSGTSLNGFNWGDGLSAVGNGADVDWDYLRVYQGDHALDNHAGVTVITHGWQAFGGQGADPPEWTLETATAVLERAGGLGSVFVHDTDNGSTSGDWLPLNALGLPNYTWTNTDSTSDEIVLVYNWVWDSNDSEDGWLAAAADNLAASLLDGPLGVGLNVLNRPIHFIGHSRGAVVNSLAVRQLGQLFDSSVVDQVTTLDPHPIRLGDGSGLFYDADDPDPFTSQNVRYADNYFRRDGEYQIDLDFDGIEVPGATNIELTNYVLDEPEESPANGDEQGFNSEHSDVHFWYGATIDPTATTYEGRTISPYMAANWWESGVTFASELEPASGRENIGFARSRIGSADRSRFEVTDGTQIGELSSYVFNGDFELGDSDNSLAGLADEIPGWERHGGTVDADLTSDGRLHLGEFVFANYESITHNPLYFPENVTGLSFDYEITDASNDDLLNIKVGPTTIGTIALDSLRTVSVTYPLDLSFQGIVDTITFEFVSGFSLNSDVYIDNVELVAAPAISNADFDNDLDVDGSDFLAWQRGFGAIFGASSTDGDSSGDYDVDRDDLNVWLGQYGSIQPAPMQGVAASKAVLLTNDNSRPATAVEELTSVVMFNWQDFATRVEGPRTIIERTVNEDRSAIFSHLEPLVPRKYDLAELDVIAKNSGEDKNADLPWLDEQLLERVFS